VPGHDDGPVDAVDHTAEVFGIVRKAAERVGDRQNRKTLALQAADDTVPARRLGEGTVDEHDGGSVGLGREDVGRHGFSWFLRGSPGWARAENIAQILSCRTVMSLSLRADEGWPACRQSLADTGVVVFASWL
jgi:hypothetical protein